MFEAISSLYNRLFVASFSAETSDAPQQSNTSSPKGFFSGWSITFLFGARASENSSELPHDDSHLETGISSAPKPSLLQRIFPYFFSTRSARNGTPDNGATLTSSILSLGEHSVLTHETISLYVDASAEGKKVDIKKQGGGKFESLETLEQINQDLAKTKQAYDRSSQYYLESFDKDANRGFTYTLEQSTFSTFSITNREITHQPDTSTEYINNTRVQQAHNVIKSLAETIFPNEGADHTAAQTTLGDNLKGISHQALFASPLIGFMKNPSSDGICLIQGTASNADFSYSITGPREIMIKATAIYQDANNNTLIGSVMNDNNETEMILLGFPKDGKNNSTGKITGSVSLNIIATVGDDGTITSLCCTSMETSWNAQLK